MSRKRRRRTRNTSEDEISASMEHGVLNIVLPKIVVTPEAPKERVIDIK